MASIQQNTFILTCERWCCIFASLFPKVFCTFVLTWSVYAIMTTIPKYFESRIIIIIEFVIINTLYILSIVTYYRIIYAGPGSPLDYPQLRLNNSENPFDSNQPQIPPEFMTIHTLKVNQGFRVCNKCKCWKPDRTHHCSSSGKCILKMDHYCPWFATCIGFFNYKFFIQFLTYVMIYCWIIFGITTYIIYNLIMTEKYKDEYLTLNLILLCVISFTFGIAVGVFTIFSYYLISKNLSTIEFQEQRWNYRGGNVYEFDRNGKQKKLANIFDLGVRENFKQVLGESLLEWILPININYKIANSGFKNGINFKVNEEVYKKWCENAELQNQLNDQLAEYKNRVRREREEYVV